MQNSSWQVRVRAADGEQATVVARQHRFDAGAPLHFDDQYNHITALEYVLGAIGADVLNCFRALARKRRVVVDSVEATVQGELDNPLTFLGVVGEAGHPGLARIHVKMYISSLSSPEEVQSVWDETLRKSPMVCTFRSMLDFDISYKLVL